MKLNLGDLLLILLLHHAILGTCAWYWPAIPAVLGVLHGAASYREVWRNGK